MECFLSEHQWNTWWNALFQNTNETHGGMLYFRTPMKHMVEWFISEHQWNTWWNALFQNTHNTLGGMLYFRTPMTHLVECFISDTHEPHGGMLSFRTPTTHLVDCFISEHPRHTWWNALFQNTHDTLGGMLYFRTPMKHMVECFISEHPWNTWWNALFHHTYLCPRKSMGALCLWPCKCPTYIDFPWQLSRDRMCPVSLLGMDHPIVYLWPYERPSDVWPYPSPWYMSRPSASCFVFTVHIK